MATKTRHQRGNIPRTPKNPNYLLGVACRAAMPRGDCGMGGLSLGDPLPRPQSSKKEGRR